MHKNTFREDSVLCWLYMLYCVIGHDEDEDKMVMMMVMMHHGDGDSYTWYDCWCSDGSETNITAVQHTVHLSRNTGRFQRVAVPPNSTTAPLFRLYQRFGMNSAEIYLKDFNSHAVYY